jgi:MscS family membrane protein
MGRMSRARHPVLLILMLTAVTLCAGPEFARAGSEETAAGEEAASGPPPAAFDSPHSTLRTFLTAMSTDPPNLERAVECLDLSGVPDEAGPQLANDLYRCINRLEWIYFADDDLYANRRDRNLLTAADLAEEKNRGITRYRLFPRDIRFATWVDEKQYERARELAGPDLTIEIVETASGAWKFSAETVKHIEELWDRLEELPTVSEFTGREYLLLAERIEALFPASLRDNSFLSVEYWQWICLFALILLGLIIDLVVRLILTTIARRMIARREGHAKSETLGKTVRPFGLAVAAVFWLLTLSELGLPAVALRVLLPAVRFFAMLAMVWAAFRVTDLVGEVAASKAARTETKFDDLVIPLIRKTLKVFIAIFGLIYIADSLEISVVPLLTGLGIGGVGFAFAAKDTLENLFGSITVIADRPFQVGDWIETGDVEGIVEEVGFRSTRVRTFYNSLVTIPNGNLVRAVVDNFGRRKYRRWSTHLNITYDTPPAKIEAFCEGIRELVRIHPYTRKDYYQVWLHQFGAHSLDILIYVFWEVPDWQTELRERHRLAVDIIRLADRLGVEFAFPTQTLHLFQEQPDGEHERRPAPAKASDFRAMRSGRAAVRELTANAAWRENKPGPYRFKDASDTQREDETGEDEDRDDETQIESKVGGDA